jgi:hypothetical protein
MNHLDPRDWSPAQRLALIAALLVACVAGSVIGFAMSGRTYGLSGCAPGETRQGNVCK